MKRLHSMPFGAELREGRTRFRLWAPSAGKVTLVARSAGGEPLTMNLARIDSQRKIGDVSSSAQSGGWYELTLEELGSGARYHYRIDDEIDVPDPASRYNPDGVVAASEVIDAAAFDWSDGDWRGRPWREAVIYELHVGTFTPEGTFAAIVPRLAELADTGITAIEIMPVASFPGDRGWGYDGVLPYAPHPAYGRPEDLKALVQAAHAHGIMVLLDVVYNHFGPQGNFLHRYARNFFTDRAHTPWGDAIDFAVPEVRQFFIQNALYWIEEFHLDGLRIDAVHAMYDHSSPHFIDELIRTVQGGPGGQRPVHIVLENHNNEARLLACGESSAEDASITASPPTVAGGGSGKGPKPFTPSCISQWNDDFHHPLHVILTGETDGYYEDFAAVPHRMLARVLAEGFAFQGEKSGFGGDRPRGQPSAHLPPTAFVNFLQTHDQIGNRAFGERIAVLAEPEPLRAAYAVLLLAPQPPMLVMGEEYAALQPFLYFCDYQGELAVAITTGRRKEFEKFRLFSDAQARERIPDPNALQTFLDSKLDWSDRAKKPQAGWLRYIANLLKVRREHVTPSIDSIEPGRCRYRHVQGVVSIDWPARNGECLTMIANLQSAAATPAAGTQRLLFSTSESVPAEARLSAWEVRLLRHTVQS